MVLRVMMCALTVVLLGGGLAESAEIATGSVRVDNGDAWACIAPNVGTGTIGHVVVNITFNQFNGAFNGTASRECFGLMPGVACDRSGLAGLDFSMYCEITFNSGKVRGTLCNVTKGLCADAR